MKKRIWTIGLVLTLAGCASDVEGALSEPDFTPEQSEAREEGGAEVESPAGEAETQNADSPRAFVFESGVLEFGDFDPYTVGDDLFNPCTEITEAEFAEAGFQRVGKVLQNSASPLTACGVEEKDGNREFASSFSNGNLNRAMVLEADLVLPEYGSETLPEIYVFRGTGTSACYAQIDTLRGGIGADVGGTRDVTTMEERCQRAVVMLEDLFLAHGVDAH